jgi:hypothetical protein
LESAAAAVRRPVRLRIRKLIHRRVYVFRKSCSPDQVSINIGALSDRGVDPIEEVRESGLTDSLNRLAETDGEAFLLTKP